MRHRETHTHTSLATTMITSLLLTRMKYHLVVEEAIHKTAPTRQRNNHSSFITTTQQTLNKASSSKHPKNLNILTTHLLLAVSMTIFKTSPIQWLCDHPRATHQTHQDQAYMVSQVLGLVIVPIVAPLVRVFTHLLLQSLNQHTTQCPQQLILSLDFVINLLPNNHTQLIINTLTHRPYPLSTLRYPSLTATYRQPLLP